MNAGIIACAKLTAMAWSTIRPRDPACRDLAPVLISAIDDARRTASTVVVRLEALTGLSSLTVATLIAADKALKSHGARLAITCRPGRVLETFRTSGLDRALDVRVLGACSSTAASD
jgi:anti-anti-sigma factor